MSFSDLVKLTDWIKLFLVEINVGHNVGLHTWIGGGGGAPNTYYISHTDGIVNTLKVDGETYSEEASLADCNSTDKSWFWSASDSRLYINFVDSEDPNAHSGFIISNFKFGFTNMQFEDEEVVFNSIWYLPYLDVDAIPDINFEVSDYYKGGVRRSFGSLKFINSDKFFDTRLSEYIFEFSSIVVKLAQKGSAYGDFAIVWEGLVGNIEWSEEEVVMDILDFMES